MSRFFFTLSLRVAYQPQFWFICFHNKAPDLERCCCIRREGIGLVGLSLSYSLAITGLLNSLLTSFAETEQEMVAVERILEYTDIQPQVCNCSQLPCWWPL